MQRILESNESKWTTLSAFITWFQQIAQPFIVRWWIWFALIVSPAYLTCYFIESTLEERINQTIRNGENAERTEKKIVKEKGLRDNVSYRAGIFVGTILGTVIKGWQALLMIILLLIALLQLQYKFVFKTLFERDALGRRVYVVLIFIGWLILVSIFSTFVGQKGSQQGYQWTLANGFVLLNIGYSLLLSWRNGRRRQLALIQQRTQAELDALKAQVNPHFLFNSLNNIYGTAISEDSPRTVESIQQLSGIVRYVMEESLLQTTDVQRELRFIDDFVELQRIRLPNQENIEISTDIDWDEQPARIVPLLLNPLIENAFKYGISIQYPCFVRIRLRVQNGTLELTTENSILPRTNLKKGTGLGLANVRQRLALAYPDRHTIRVEEQDGLFRVDLTIIL